MSSDKPRNKEKIRLLVLSSIVVIVISLGCIRLMDYQIVNGQSFAEQAASGAVTYETVEAARGEITDRYGRSLVTNKLALNIQLNRALLPKGQENEVIIRLIRLFQENNEDWVNDFPITSEKQNGEYQFLSSSDANEQAKIDRQISNLKEALKVQKYATAQNCIDLLIKECEITGYSEEETRQIAGIRGQMMVNNFSERNPYTFAEDVNKDFAAQLVEMSNYVPGVAIAETSVREYANPSLAPHILGTIGPIQADAWEELKKQGYLMTDYVGREGIEALMEDDLRGINGRRAIEKNQDGDVVNEYMQQEAEPGDTVVLTIDANFQQQVQDILARHIEEWRRTSEYSQTEGGSIVVLNAKNNEVLAMANYPSYDLNAYKTDYESVAAIPFSALTNRATMGLYRPGSTFKTVVGVGGVSEGIITGNSTFNCQHVMYYNNDLNTPYTCLGWHGPINLYDALKVSCNIFFYNVGMRLGDANLEYYGNKLGLGTDTGIEITNAETADDVNSGLYSQITTKENSERLGVTWNAGDVLQASIGQKETYVTPLQMAVQASTIANKGVRYNAHLVKSVEKYDYSQTVRETEVYVMDQLPDTNNAFEEVITGMKRVTSNTRNVAGLDVAMKTGSPQLTTTVFSSATVAFYPTEEPEIAIGIMVEKGGVAKDMLAEIVHAYEQCKAQAADLPQATDQLIVN